MTTEELYQALINERFRDAQWAAAQVPDRPVSHGGPDTDRACSARRRALVASMERGNRDQHLQPGQ